jgi:hypothetical protein
MRAAASAKDMILCSRLGFSTRAVLGVAVDMKKLS